MSFISQTAASLTTGLFSCLVPSSGGALPTDYPGLTAWWDPKDTATVTLGVGSNIVQIDDKSGNGNHLAQSSASAQPALLAGGTIFFIGSGRYLEIPTLNEDFGDNATHSFFAYTSVASVNPSAIITAYDSFIQGAFSINVNNDSTIDHLVNTTGTDGTATVPYSAAGDGVLAARYTGTKVTLYEDGVTDADTATGTTGTINEASFNILVGARSVFLSVTNFITGNIGEMIFYNEDVGADAQSDLTSYIANKWS